VAIVVAADEDLLDKALDWIDQGRRVAVATVVDTWGSSPRPRGSQLVVRDDGLFLGSVSGGCVESKVVEAAQVAMNDRAHRLLEFGVSHETAWDVGLACGGTVRIYVEPVRSGDSAPGGPLDRAVLETVRRARAGQRAVVLLTPLDGRPVTTWANDDPALEPALAQAAHRAIVNDDAATVETSSGRVFVQAINPPLKLVIVGAVHIAQPLVQIASLLGYEITLVDPREAFARAERWPGITVANDWPDERIRSMHLDHRSAVVALTHDPKVDDAALEAALQSAAFYVGALGSMKTHGARLQRLQSRGFTADALGRIHGPIGLRIGARSPGEIAVAIVAQMTESLRRAPAASHPGS
jgi:xanthine dehydrogenase accessory factor